MSSIYKVNSCLTAILNCKLYKSSTRKDKIRAGLENPVNAELVKQLDEYLDEEYRPKKPVEVADTNETSQSSDDEWNFDEVDNESSSSGSSSHMSHRGPSLSERFGDELDAEGAAKFDETQITDDTTEETSDDTQVAESSTAIRKNRIAADTIVTAPFVENHVSLTGIAGEIKGTLNARAATQGVVRSTVKNDELWIYYSDDTNLNNVMSAVIELLNAANYQFLIFNRLARTDNAIVFTINSNDTLNAMEPVQNEK